MNFYNSAFVALISGCGLLTWQQYHTGKASPETQALLPIVITPLEKAEAKKLKGLFLVVYCLVMASDWLQGPYVYSLYKDQFGHSERIVALLFTTGFLSGAISGHFVGQFGDKYGRKTACLVFCVTYSIACFSTLIENVPVLFFGRVFGGLSTSLLYSAFESWMVTEYHKRNLEKSGTSLSNIFGVMTTLNSIVAILAGVFSEWLVTVTKTKRAPFMASAGLLAIAFWTILTSWNENYGDTHKESSSTVNPASTSEPPSTSEPSSKLDQLPKRSALKTVFTSQRILTLGLASCFFEGSMYLFVFFWTSALKVSQGSHYPLDLPLGMIFACFMSSVMLGSLLFNLIVSKYQLISHTHLLTLTIFLAGASLALPIFLESSTLTFCSFLVFELCVGFYYPSIGYLKGLIIEDGMRARVYGMLRIPLNVFFVVALVFVKEGEGYRNLVYMVCSGLLIVTSRVFYCAIGE